MKFSTLILRVVAIVLLLSINCFALEIAPQLNSDFYVLENQAFNQIRCEIRPTTAKAYLESLQDGSANDSVKYTVSNTLKDYNFSLSNGGEMQISPAKIIIDIQTIETADKTEEAQYVTATAWKRQTEGEFQNLIHYSSLLVKDVFHMLQPNKPEGRIISRREKNGLLTMRYGSVFSTTIRTYKQTDKGGLLIESSSELTDFKRKLSIDKLSIVYQQLNGLFIPKKASRSLFINRSVDGKTSAPQDIVIEFVKCAVVK